MTNLTNSSCPGCVIEGLAYGSVFLLGLVINVAALCAFVAKRKLWTDTHIYMFNLVLADSALVVFLPFRIYDCFFCLAKTRLCTLLISIHYINMYASILTTTAISVQRYLSVRFPLWAHSWRWKKEMAVAVCLLIWATVVSVCVGFLGNNEPANLWTCYERRKDKPLELEFMVTLIAAGYALPLLIVAFCTWQILALLPKDGSVSPLLQRSITGIVTANLAVFVLCYMPVHLAFVLNYIYRARKNCQYQYIHAIRYLTVSEWIAATNCCFDSFSYYFLLKDTFFRRR